MTATNLQDDLQDNRLVRTFADLRASGKRTLMPFLTAGCPDLDTTAALLEDFEARGVRICELGFPFSDPVADGPTIQASYTRALADGITCDGILDRVAGYRRRGGKLALAAMASYSIVFKRGVETFLRAAAMAGFDGTIIPDLPLDEADELAELAEGLGLANVLLIAPTTPPPRRLEIARRSRGFIYYVSVAGITGQRAALPHQTIAAVAELRKHTATPVCVGFGISSPEMVAGVCEVADGAIVGSAIVRRILDAHETPRDDLVPQIGRFVSDLLAPLQ